MDSFLAGIMMVKSKGVCPVECLVDCNVLLDPGVRSGETVDVRHHRRSPSPRLNADAWVNGMVPPTLYAQTQAPGSEFGGGERLVETPREDLLLDLVHRDGDIGPLNSAGRAPWTEDRQRLDEPLDAPSWHRRLRHQRRRQGSSARTPHWEHQSGHARCPIFRNSRLSTLLIQSLPINDGDEQANDY